jgi:hypothetical protein
MSQVSKEEGQEQLLDSFNPDKVEPLAGHQILEAELIIEKMVFETEEEYLNYLDEENEKLEKKSDLNEKIGLVKMKKLSLKESELIQIIKNLVSESNNVDKKFELSRKKSGDENKKALKDVEKKIKDYMNFDGAEKKVAFETNDEQNQTIEDNRGKGIQDLKYDFEPSKEYKDRQKKAMEGDTTMGNQQDKAVGIEKSDVGKKMMKSTERKLKIDKEAPMYGKDPQPTKNVNEGVNKELEYVKKLWAYNGKTQ